MFVLTQNQGKSESSEAPADNDSNGTFYFSARGSGHDNELPGSNDLATLNRLHDQAVAAYREHVKNLWAQKVEMVARQTINELLQRLPDSIKDMRGVDFLQRCDRDPAFRSEYGDMTSEPERFMHLIEPEVPRIVPELHDQS
jgi:hypothetical protein